MCPRRGRNPKRDRRSIVIAPDHETFADQSQGVQLATMTVIDLDSYCLRRPNLRGAVFVAYALAAAPAT